MRGEKIVDATERAWWLSVLAGETSRPHPVFVDLEAAVNDGVMVVHGRVPSAEAHDSILATIRSVCGANVEGLQDEIVIEPEENGDNGLLKQTVVGVFGDEKEAAFALEYMRGRLGPAAEEARLTLVQRPGELKRVIPPSYLEDAREALKEGNTLIAATVDETSAFALRKLLDEETQSRAVLITPPEPMTEGATKGHNG